MNVNEGIEVSLEKRETGGDAEDEAGKEEEREAGQNGIRAAGVKGRYWRRYEWQADGMKGNR